MLFVLPEDSQTGSSVLSTQYTLRHCNKDFRNITGYMGQTPSMPEIDNMRAPGKICPLMTFNNTFGHWYGDRSRTFPPEHVESLGALCKRIEHFVRINVRKGSLWDLHETRTYVYSRINRVGGVTDQFKIVADLQNSQSVPHSPISVHTVQAYLDAVAKRTKSAIDQDREAFGISQLFMCPSQSTVVTGIHGGLHNNTNLEMGFIEADGERDAEKRTYDESTSGYICSGHTAHSGDAGKNRRICSYTRVRVIHPTILRPLLNISEDDHQEKEWLVYCMGITCYCSEDAVWEICYTLLEQSKIYYKDQFPEEGGSGDMLCPATFCVYEKQKVIVISVSSGVVLRAMPDDTMIDSCLMKLSSHSSILSIPPLPTKGPDVIKYLYSPTFMLGNYIQHDRPPRTLFASGQTTQGIFHPWAIGTARVSPTHSSKPLVATEFVRRIEKDHEENEDAIWDIYPGECLTVCYHNMPLNYEDSMVLSSAFADRCGFSTLSLCTYRTSESEKLPEPGERVCGKEYKWWKMECTEACKCKIKGAHKFKDLNKVISTSCNVPTAKVYEKIRTEDGGISMKILSYSQILTGDKVSTMHGQKGICTIVPQHELPLIVMENGGRFYADIYIAVGSIVSRQTSGQIYDSSHGLRAAREGKMATSGFEVDTSSESFKYIIRPQTGEILTRKTSDEVEVPVRGTIGIARIINQTQMTRERHHLTHRPEGQYSTGTRSGRADGGGVATSEMDFHAMFSAGLYGCAQELYERGNMVVADVCSLCHAIVECCDCGFRGEDIIKVRLPYDMIVFDMISASTKGTCNRYYVEHV